MDQSGKHDEAKETVVVSDAAGTGSGVGSNASWRTVR
jgi:hypothetical protein